MSSLTSAPQGSASFPPASLDRRFYAFAIDRAIAWGLDAVAVVVAWRVWSDGGQTWPGVGLIVGTVLLVGLVLAVVAGTVGTSPGKAMLGLRLVDHDRGTPIGVGRALLRTLILGAGGLPTFGLGVATLAQTALMDPERQRRGWHDRVSHGIVVDLRPAPELEEIVVERPHQIVNLTAMRLAPVDSAPAPRPTPARPAPERRPEPRSAPATASDVRAAASPSPSAPPPAAPAAPAPAPPAPAPTAAIPSAAIPPVPVVPKPAKAKRRDKKKAAPPPPTSTAPLPPPPATPPTTPPATPPGAPGSVPRRPQRPVAETTAERTVVRTGEDAAQHSIARWTVTFDTGESMIVEGLALVGRRPEGRPGEPVRHLLPLPSKDMSLSKTHAQFQVAPDGTLVVMDRGSTNGSTLVRSGVSRELPAGKPTSLLSGDEVHFGDRVMKVERQG